MESSLTPHLTWRRHIVEPVQVTLPAHVGMLGKRWVLSFAERGVEEVMHTTMDVSIENRSVGSHCF